MSIRGVITKIEQYAVHDGPGLRCLVLLKGCPLRCKWCQNPETIYPGPEVWFHELLCKEDGRCVEACPNDAVTMEKDRKIIREECDGCFKCVEPCRHGALQVVGEEIGAEDLFRQIAQFRRIYDRSDRGGITLGGGEPLFQPEFTAEVFRLCREANIHTAVETCLYARYEDVWKVAIECSLLMCDMKHMDSDRHKEGTGVSNELILENLKRLNQDYEGEIYVRIPLIPGQNDEEENIVKTLEFLYPLARVQGVDFLPFNAMPTVKYKALSQDWEFEGVSRQSDEHCERWLKIAESYKRFKCTVGGLW